MKELFEKVYIRSEADLPKEKINVFMYDEKNYEGFYVTINPLDIGQKEHLPNVFTWYLQPVPSPTDEEIERWAEEFVKNPEHYFHSVKDLILGAKALRDGKIKPNKYKI